MICSRRDCGAGVLKRGAIISASLLVLGAALLWLLGTVGILNGEVLVHATEALAYGCLAVFGVFWIIDQARKPRP
jgi:hypothetical protein